ncbi:MAG: glutaryl-7-ACA acylase [Sphingomonas sp. SCN 67-18]|uniref:CocE/NonD family hydrolase n=1 Tax=uncultured Sphingomonas sp. TaxID=158754 RepID=UPI00086CE885|nr:CocE/NonD family hydrolase [Sphingomonas sp. SCN 67-18]ODU21625.1 MAG: glutaryl-7-ACA acylase [Sphingomonas sp. SCN 67-18]
MAYRVMTAAALAAGLVLATGTATAQKRAPAASDTPRTFVQATEGMDHERREVMIPMRDGVRLHTVILIPKGARNAPILLTRTPYDASDMTSHSPSGTLAAVLDGYDNAPDVVVGGGYIRVVQDVRGKYGSEGDYIMNRPLAGTPLNPGKVDHSTDAYDTIDWLVKHIPESNGRVGIIGISYDGFLPLMALINPHPALKVAVPMNPMVDGWNGDDWFHNGAFRQQNLPYMLEQEASRDNSIKWWSTHRDDYDLYLSAGSAGALARSRGLDQTGFWTKVAQHPSYDDYWQQQAMDRVLAARPLTVPTLLVHGLFDQEDIHGAIAVWQALKDRTGGQNLKLAIGPWNHGQQIHDASALGPIKWGQDTGLWFRRNVLAPFLAQYLIDGAPTADLPRVTAFETGSNAWRRLADWPAACADDCTARLYLKPQGALGFEPATGPAETADYISDPAKPVPFRARPILPVGYEGELTWPSWLVDDQREASGRTDVITFVTPVLTAPVRIKGKPVVHLTAATSGTDADWVVKLIDVYPAEVAGDKAMGGYQLGIAMDIFRGRYRESLSEAKPIAADTALPYRFALPDANHVFLPGHRIMVQVQSSWFPLYDRNPQRFVPNIMFAKPEDYVKATQRITVAGPEGSYIVLPLVPAGAE